MFEWEIAKNPQTQRITFSFNPDGKFGNTIFETWQISGNKRVHIIPKELYKYDEYGEYQYNIFFAAINYIETERCFIGAYSSEWEWYPLYP